MINSVKPNLIVSDSRGAWFRATILFILALIGTVGMWSVVVFIPDIEKEFGLDDMLQEEFNMIRENNKMLMESVNMGDNKDAI